MSDEDTQTGEKRMSQLAYFAISLAVYIFVFLAGIVVLSHYNFHFYGVTHFVAVFFGLSICAEVAQNMVFRLLILKKPESTTKLDVALFIAVPVITFIISRPVIFMAHDHHYDDYKEQRYSGETFYWYGYKTTSGKICYFTALGADLRGRLVVAGVCSHEKDNYLSVLDPKTRVNYSLFYWKRRNGKNQPLACLDFNKLDIAGSEHVSSRAIIYLFFLDYKGGHVKSDVLNIDFGMMCFPRNLAPLISKLPHL